MLRPLSCLVSEQHEGGLAVGLNLVLVQNPWTRAAVSQGATVGRQDIPAQDEEMSVTTCYANPRAEEGKRGEGELTGKTVFDGDYVFVCALAGGIMCMYACVC